MKRGGVAAAMTFVVLLAWVGTSLAQSAPQTFVLYQAPGEENFTVYAAGPISGVGTDYLLEESVDPATGRTQRRTETVFAGGPRSTRSPSWRTTSPSTR